MQRMFYIKTSEMRCLCPYIQSILSFFKIFSYIHSIEKVYSNFLCSIDVVVVKLTSSTYFSKEYIINFQILYQNGAWVRLRMDDKFHDYHAKRRLNLTLHVRRNLSCNHKMLSLHVKFHTFWLKIDTRNMMTDMMIWLIPPTTYFILR